MYACIITSVYDLLLVLLLLIMIMIKCDDLLFLPTWFPLSLRAALRAGRADLAVTVGALDEGPGVAEVAGGRAGLARHVRKTKSVSNKAY